MSEPSSDYVEGYRAGVRLCEERIHALEKWAYVVRDALYFYAGRNWTFRRAGAGQTKPARDAIAALDSWALKELKK